MAVGNNKWKLFTCSKGLVQPKIVGTPARYKHISKRVMDEFPLVLENVVSQSRLAHDRFQISMQAPVENPVSTIETFARQFALTQNETEVVKKAFYLEQGVTMFHVINSFTRAAQETGLSASDAYRLETTGGRILAMVK